MKKLLTGISLLAAGLISLPASAIAIPSTLTQVQKTFSGNDCSGYFGQGFGACEIFFGDDRNDPDRIKISPVIVKYDLDNNKTEVNTSLFPSFDGIEISYDLVTQDWTYTPGENNPGIRYVAAKGGNKFNLIWYVDSDTVGNTCANAFSLDCLNLAQAVEQGSWTVPENKGLSHLTFYDSVPPRLVSEPGTIGLLALSMLGLGLARRRTARQS